MKIRLPNNKVVNLTDPIIEAGHFNWSEATKSGERLPKSNEVLGRIVAIATALEEVREFLGNRPMNIHSWYRTPAVNRAVGGAKDSRHLYGDAVDFSIEGINEGINPLNVYDKLDNWWGDRGGLGKHQAFTHIDLRGIYARWDY